MPPARTKPLSLLPPASRRLPRRSAATALLAAACAVSAGCGSSTAPAAPTAPAALPACRTPQAAVLPHTAGSLTQTDTGAYCLGVGQTLDVFLTAPATATAPHPRWSQVAIGDASILAYGNNGVMTPPVNVTPAVVVGQARGTSTISSTLPDGRKWTATIVVG